jgi:hypothetical protein
VGEEKSSPYFHFAKLQQIMIKAIITFFRNFYEKDIDYEFELEFSIYDIILGVLILIWILWILLK